MYVAEATISAPIETAIASQYPAREMKPAKSFR
jgi:hypothetical protein